MTPTIEEVKGVCEQCGMFPPSNFKALQAFAQHYIEVGRKEQRAIDDMRKEAKKIVDSLP